MGAETVGMYLASDGEIDLGPTMAWCWENRITTCVPVMGEDDRVLSFAAVDRDTPLAANRFGILEPRTDGGEGMDAGALDVLLMPLVAFDALGNRLGMGGGFYDTTLRANREAGRGQPLLAGVAHEIQRVERIDADPWDMPLDVVVTDVAIHRFANTATAAGAPSSA